MAENPVRSDARPLGIWELVRDLIADRETPEHWYWCRRHEKAEHANEPTSTSIPRGRVTHHLDCVRVGPFMTEREANRHGGGSAYLDSDELLMPLGMEVEQ